MHFSGHELNQLISAYGYWAVMLFVGVESIGFPFPGETMLLAAAIYAGTTHNLDIALVITAASVGAVLGDNIGYWFGREFGYELLLRYGRYFHFDQTKMKLGMYLFHKHGGKVVFFGRFVAVLRAFAALLAGINQMDWRRFFVFNVAGGAVVSLTTNNPAVTIPASVTIPAGSQSAAFLITTAAVTAMQEGVITGSYADLSWSARYCRSASVACASVWRSC